MTNTFIRRLEFYSHFSLKILNKLKYYIMYLNRCSTFMFKYQFIVRVRFPLNIYPIRVFVCCVCGLFLNIDIWHNIVLKIVLRNYFFFLIFLWKRISSKERDRGKRRNTMKIPHFIYTNKWNRRWYIWNRNSKLNWENFEVLHSC